MFTGIIEEKGIIKDISHKSRSSKVVIGCKKVLESINIGDSICVNGVCLTVTKYEKDYFCADISYETLQRSSYKNMIRGDKVNLERALQLSSRLGGHIVLGHIDSISIITDIVKGDESYSLYIKYPLKLDRYIVEKGSISVDGISLTIANIKSGILEIAVIPHTYKNTNLLDKSIGSIVNIEVDHLAKYVEKLILSESKEDNLLKMISKLKRTK